MYINRWMDKEVVVHIYNGILLNCKKEYIWVSSNKVDEPRAYYTEWSESERERQISYINAYIWNLERWYWWTCMQGSSGDTGREKRLVDTGREGGQIERVALKHTLPHVKLYSQWKFIVWPRDLKSRAPWQPRRVGLQERWEEGWRVREQTYTYDWFMLMYGRNQHNIVKQLC